MYLLIKLITLYLYIVKKITIALLTVVYLLSAIGMQANSFYCCGILRATTLTFAAPPKANCKAPVHMHACCKTKTQVLKVNDKHFGADAAPQSVKVFALCHQPLAALYNLGKSYGSPVHNAFYSHAPPLGQHAPIYTLNCTYRI